jgi:DNA-binding PadR family transcriptional regulator
MARRKQGEGLGMAMLRVAALGFLAERPMHAYEMYQLALKRGEDRVVNVSPGSLYRAVYALEDRGYAAEFETFREGPRPERTTFEITQAGREAYERELQHMIEVPAEEYPEYLLAVSGLHALAADVVRDAISRRNRHLGTEVEAIDAATEEADKRGVPEMYVLHRHLRRHMICAEIDWNEQLMARLDARDIPWQDDRSPEERAKNGPAPPEAGARRGRRRETVGDASGRRFRTDNVPPPPPDETATARGTLDRASHERRLSGVTTGGGTPEPRVDPDPETRSAPAELRERAQRETEAQGWLHEASQAPGHEASQAPRHGSSG